MDNIEYALAHLKIKVIDKPDWKSKYAESILDFWMLPTAYRFHVHGYVFKGMDIAELVRTLAVQPPSQSDAGAKP